MHIQYDIYVTVLYCINNSQQSVAVDFAQRSSDGEVIFNIMYVCC